MIFRPGEPVEWDSAHTHAERNGCITYPSKRPVVIRGVYVKRVSAEYSDVSVGGAKPLLVRTSRLRPEPALTNGGGEAA